MNWDLGQTAPFSAVPLVERTRTGRATEWSRREVRKGVLTSMMLLGGELLPRGADVQQWFEEFWFGNEPEHAWTPGIAVVGALPAAGYAAIIAIGMEVRAVYVAGALGGRKLGPEEREPYRLRLQRLGYRLRVHAGGWSAEENLTKVDARDAVRNGLHAVVTLSQLARDAGAASSLPVSTRSP